MCRTILLQITVAFKLSSQVSVGLSIGPVSLSIMMIILLLFLLLVSPSPFNSSGKSEAEVHCSIALKEP